MKSLSMILLAAVVGFAGGIVLSSIIGIIGFAIFDQPAGIRGLPIVTALAAAGVVALRQRQEGTI